MTSKKTSLNGKEEKFVVPGMRLCGADDGKFRAGKGTYILHGFIYSSLVGILKLETYRPDTAHEDKDKKEAVKEILNVEVVSPSTEQNRVPKEGDIVTAKVLTVNPRSAKLHIICVQNVPLTEPYRAQLRKEDVRATERDRVEMYNCFRPGDIILARILSLGEASSGYLITTAENELGVVIARAETSRKCMIPVSWTEMQCPDTYAKESRKIAKVCPENLAEFAMEAQ